MANNSGIEALKFPVFIPEDPGLWMAQMEAAFRANNISNPARKYNYLLSSLNEEAAKEVRHLIIHPLITEDTAATSKLYEQEKQILLQRLRAPVTRRLLEHEQMGEQRPWNFLNHLMRIAGNEADEYVVKSQWILKLPDYMHKILNTRMLESIDSIGRLADSLFEIVRNERDAAAAASKQQPQQQAAPEKSQMTEEGHANEQTLLLQRIEAMKIQIAEFAGSMNDQMEEMRLVVNALQNADQAPPYEEIVKPN